MPKLITAASGPLLYLVYRATGWVWELLSSPLPLLCIFAKTAVSGALLAASLHKQDNNLKLNNNSFLDRAAARDTWRGGTRVRYAHPHPAPPGLCDGKGRGCWALLPGAALHTQRSARPKRGGATAGHCVPSMPGVCCE